MTQKTSTLTMGLTKDLITVPSEAVDSVIIVVSNEKSVLFSTFSQFCKTIKNMTVAMNIFWKVVKAGSLNIIV